MSRPIHLNEHEARVMARLQPGERVQIWRPVKPQPEPPAVIYVCDGANTRIRPFYEWHSDGFSVSFLYEMTRLGEVPHQQHDYTPSVNCPYGAPGDRVLCKETWAWVPYPGAHSTPRLCLGPDDKGATWKEVWQGNPSGLTWLSAARMPSWAVRHQPLIQEVRVMRLHEAKEDDLLGAGYEPPVCWTCKGRGTSPSGDVCPCEGGYDYGRHADEFREVWDSRYGRNFPSSSNPWAWVLTLEVTK